MKVIATAKIIAARVTPRRLMLAVMADLLFLGSLGDLTVGATTGLPSRRVDCGHIQVGL